MKTSKHWWFERESRRISGNYCLIVHGPNKNNWETVAEVPGEYNKKTKEYEFPNAHLISAAPELLESLKAILAEFEVNYLSSMPEGPSLDAGKKMIKIAKKVIIKAESK